MARNLSHHVAILPAFTVIAGDTETHKMGFNDLASVTCIFVPSSFLSQNSLLFQSALKFFLSHFVSRSPYVQHQENSGKRARQAGMNEKRWEKSLPLGPVAGERKWMTEALIA